MSLAWSVEVARADGALVCRAPLLPDWEAASVWVRFEGIRRGALAPLLTSEPGRVLPVWDAERGAPYVAAVQLSIPTANNCRSHAGEDAVRDAIPVSYLDRQVADVLRALAAQGTVAQGEIVYPRVCAQPIEPAPAEPEAGAWAGVAVEELPRELRLVDTPIARFTRVATPRDLRPEANDVPVFLPGGVVAEVEALARDAGDVETGGFLVGRLHRDAELPDCFVEVTAQVPARHALAERTRLTFTPDTWSAAACEIAARGRDEELVGWWHAHPYFCRPCPAERRRSCTLDSAFFSAEDVRLHALCFRQAHQVALLLSARESGALERSLFGWRRGSVAARGFYETTGRRALAEVAP